MKQHQALRDRIRAANGLDLAKAKVASPASDKLMLALGVAFNSMTAHARRHHWQAQQILNKIKA